MIKNDFSSSLYSSKDSENVSNKNISVHLALPPNQALLFNKCNNSPPEQNVDRKNVANFRYFDTGEIQALNLYGLDNSLSFFDKKCAH